MDNKIQEFNSAGQAEVLKYRNAVLKVRKTHAHIQFNKQCLQNNVTPKYAKITIKHNTKAARITETKSRTQYIKENIKQLYIKKDNINNVIYKLHLTLLHILGSIITDEIVTHTNNWAKQKTLKLKQTHKKKLNNLIKEKTNITLPQSTHIFYPRTINLTNTQFEHQEMTLINKGLNHNMQYTTGKNTNLKLVLNTETAIQQTDINDQDSLRHDTKNIIKTKGHKYHHRNTETQTSIDIKQKITDNKISLVKADKGNTTVIINTDTLNNKITDYIKNNNITQLKADPTDKYQNNTRQTINSMKHILNDNQKRTLKQIHPKAPTLQALPKIHKKDIPIRPVINNKLAPAHKLAKFIEQTIRQHINIHTETYIKNTTDLVNKIKDTIIPHNSTLASFDITNLYTNIPVPQTLSILKNQLQHNNLQEEYIMEIMKALNIITSQNYFNTQEQFFHQPEGLPMGSPISSILAEIFLQHIERTHILNNNKYAHKIIYWYRYVDDIIVLYNGNKRQCCQLLTHINKIHPKLNFTAEYEQDNRLHFLDVTITKKDNRHNFNIYRKPTTTDTLIHNSSNHPTQHKHAAFRSMLHRLKCIPLSAEDSNTELNTIKYMAHTNGYKPELVDTLWRRIQNKTTNRIQENNKYITLTYINKNSEKIANKFRKTGYKVAFRTQNKIKHSLKVKTGINNRFDAPGVYKLTCSDCSKFYIGQTGRNFSQRFKEHVKALHNNTESAFANHLIDSGHTYTDINTNLEILHTHKKGKHLNTLEQYEIYKNTKINTDNILNEQLQYKSHTLFDLTLNLPSKLAPRDGTAQSTGTFRNLY
jgi:hypothetical protein